MGEETRTRASTGGTFAIPDLAPLLSLLDTIAAWEGTVDAGRMHSALAKLRQLLKRLDVDSDYSIELQPVGDNTAELMHVLVESEDSRRSGQGMPAFDAPLFVDGEFRAVLRLCQHASVVRSEPVDLMRQTVIEASCVAIATALGAAWGTHEHRVRVDTLLATDALTELPNRPAFIRALTSEFSFAEPARSLVVAVVDVNGMLLYNDRYGHVAGDALLNGIGELMREVAGELPGTTVARLGGDEFGLLTAEHPIEDVVAAVGRLHARASNDLHVTLGTGVAEHRPGDGVNAPGDFLRKADEAQHRAKRSHAAEPVVALADPQPTPISSAPLAPVTPLRGRRRWFRDRDDETTQ